jgi:hypothetical protein
MSEPPAGAQPQASIPPAVLQLGYKWIATGLAVLLLIALATLAVVAERQGNEALTTVVLALALLSFVLQILFFIVQAASASQQMVQGQELYGRTLAALATLSERADTTQRAVERLTQPGLGAAIEKGLGQTVIERQPGSSAESTQEFARRVTENVFPYLPTETRGDDLGRSEEVPVYPRRRYEPQDRDIVRLLETFPETRDEALPYVAQLENMGSLDLWTLRGFGEDEIRTRRPDSSLAPGFFSDEPELTRAGFLVEASPRIEHGGRPLLQLTDAGRSAARLLTAKGDIPPHLADTALPEIRFRIEEWERDMDRGRTDRGSDEQDDIAH